MNKLSGSQLAGGKGTNQRIENDFYATNPISVIKLLENYKVDNDSSIYEPCCGQGHISETIKNFYPNTNITSTDLINRGYGIGNIDFLKIDENKKYDYIITNPPFKLAKEFITKSLNICNKSVCMFLKIQFLESVGRKEWLKNSPLKYVYVFSERQCPMRNGIEINPKTGKKWSNTICFAWFIWEKNYKGEPIIRWI